MGQKYGQLSLDDRCIIARLSEAGKTIRQIAAAMDRQPSTIARELKRNSGTQVAIAHRTLSSRPKADAGEEVGCCESPLCKPWCLSGWRRDCLLRRWRDDSSARKEAR